MPDKETLRVEAFSDGVFSIALTLLIVEIRLPSAGEGGSGDLLRALGSLWPSYLAFFMSFVTVLIMWINHHEFSRLVHGLNRRYMFATGFLLLVVIFVNFPTAVLAGHLKGAEANVAAAFYCGSYVLVSLAYNLLLYSALPNMSEGVRRGPGSPVPRIRAAYLGGLGVYSVATVVAVWAPLAGLAICLLPWVLWTTLSYRPRATMGAA